jgi:hypothetical protein
MSMRARRLMPMAVFAVAASAATSAFAQESGPSRDTATALLNGKKVAVDYGRPALHGRTVKAMLAQLPPNRVWRAGVNEATTLSTESDLVIGGQKVPAGRYTLYLYAPESGDYSLLVNSDLGRPVGGGTNVSSARMWPHIDDYPSIQDKEVARIPLKSVAPAEPMDRFFIGLAPAKGGTSAITLAWGDQSWTADIKAAGPAK